MSETQDVSDEMFMDIIREYPAIYERSSASFRDKNKKTNSWCRVAEATNMDVQKAMARYNSIRTQFSRYIKSLRGKSGQGRDDRDIKPEFEYLRWLITYIKHRETTTKVKVEDSPSSSPIPSQLTAESGDELIELSIGTNKENSSVVIVDDLDKVEGDARQPLIELPENTTPLKPESGRKKRKRSTPVGEWSKIKPLSLDERLSRSIDEVSKAIKDSEKENNSQDEETLYCLSLVPTLKTCVK